MPDRDVFNRKVKSGWQAAARRMIGAANDPDALPSVLRALGKEIKSNGCPGVDQIVRVIVDAIRSPDPRTARKRAHEQLEEIRRDQGSGNTEIAVAFGRKLLAGAPDLNINGISPMDDDQLRLHLSILILADLADASTCPAAVLAEIVEGGEVSFQDVSSRRQHLRDMIASAPEIRRLAVQLLVDPSGSSVRLPRIPRAKVSQAEILVTALTE